MNNRSQTFVLVGAISGCLLLVACVVIGVAGFLFVSNGMNLANVLAPPPPAQVNRIAYVGNDMNIYVADPNTGASVSLTTDGGAEHAYNYPTWAPDNRHVAFVGYTISNGSPTEGTLFSVTPTGEKLTPLYRTDQYFPFYLYWSPDSQFVTFLTNKDPQVLALRIAKS